MLDVARAAGVSKNTVSLALRNDRQIPPGTRHKISEIACRLGYRKNPTVAHLMAQLRAGGASPGLKATLALLNANEDPAAFRTHPTIPTYIAGCRRRSGQTGYSLDEFWLHDPQLDGERLNKILRARNIRGVIIAGLMNNNHLPDRFLPVWREHPCVVTGVRTRSPALSFASTDHHMLVLRAFENALRLGYKRPGLVLDAVIDQLVECRFTSGYGIGQKALPAAQRLKPFYAVSKARNDPGMFLKWLDKEKPDLILTLYHVVRHWLEGAGIRVPEDVGIIQLEWRADHASWAGMHQHNDIVGEAAVEMLVGMIHNNERDIPLFPRATLIGSTWVNGATVQTRDGAATLNTEDGG
jgi:LacI family transcriptional regulator